MLELVGYWLLFGVAHSVLASEQVKAQARELGDHAKRFYRLAYSGASMTLLAPIVFFHVQNDTKYPFLWAFTGNGLVASRLFSVACALLFAISMKLYNMSDFLGIGALWPQPKKKDSSAALGGDDAFSITVFHRFVRHPWYFFMLGIAWSQSMNTPRLISASCGTLYILIGSLLEEEKLKAHPGWGKQYAEYARRVAGVVPLPWKVLSHDEAEQLVKEAAGNGRFRCSRRSLERSPRRDSDEE